MLAIVIAAAVAAVLAVLQASFLSQLPAFFASVSLVTAAMCVAIVAGYDLEAAVIALVGGMLLDLHGALGFGTEIAAAFAAFIVMRVLFGRFLSNASLTAIFLLAALGVLTHVLALAGVDGLRVLSGKDPYLLVSDPELVTGPLLAMCTTGLATVLAILVARAGQRVAARIFLSSKLSLKL